MYGTTKKRICPRCGKRDFEENGFCTRCLTILVENRASEYWSNWTANRM